MAKPRKTFAEIDAARPRYDPAVTGYGNPEVWTRAFHTRMGFEEAQRVIHGARRTPRQILGVDASASWAAVTKAYRQRVVACHPDRITHTGMSAAAANEALKQVNAAFAVLAREYGR